MQRGRNNDLTKLNHHPSSFSSDRIEEKNNFIYFCEQLRVGDHLIWEQVDPQSYTGSRLENVLKLPKEKRLSCLIDINFPYNELDYYCFLFDEPFNTKPSEAERYFAQINKQTNYLPNLFLIADSTWKRQGIVLSYAKSISNKSFVKCKLENCIQIGQRYQFVSVCEVKFHYCCQAHFIPIGETSIQWCDEIRDYLVTRCSNHCLNSPSPHLEMGVRYLYLMYTHFRKVAMKRLVSLVTESNVFLCPFCLENEKNNLCPLDMLEQQLKNPPGFIPPEEVAEIIEEGKKESKQENNGHEGNVDEEDEINYDRTDPYARKVTEGIKRSNSFKSGPEKQLGVQPEATKSVDLDETGITFRQTRKWNNLSSTAKRRLLDWELHLEKDYFAKREEVEAIYQQQSGFELEEITLQVLKVLIASSREKSMAPAARRLGPLSSSVDAANTNLSNLNQTTLKSSSKRIDSYDGMPLANASTAPVGLFTSPLRIRSIEIKVCQPEKPDIIKTVHFITDLTYDEILRKCCEALLIFMDWRSMSLVKRNADGWNERIYAEKSYPFHDSYGESICGTINDQDIIEVRRTTGAFLGGRYYLQSIVDSYQQNASIQQKISQLNSNYIGYREIRGDGNCYYRSIFCGIIECLISAQDITKREEGFQYLFDTFRSISYRAPPMSHTSLLRILQAAAANRKWITIAEFEADILDEASGLDEIAIYDCKRLIIDYILLYKEKEFNGITIENAILYTNEKYERSLINYCQEEILKMEICAEGVHVDLGILPCLLGSKCEIIYLDREENNQLTIRETNGLPLQKEIASISLLFRPGHYDLLYKRHETLVAKPPMIENVQAANKPFSNPTPRRLSESQEVVAPMDISPRDSNHFNTNRALIDSSSVAVAETFGNVIVGSTKEPISTRKPEIDASPPKLSSAEVDALIDTLQENDFSLSLHRESIKKLLEMGFSLEIILDVWVKYRSMFFRYDVWLERCIALAEDKEKAQVEEERASVMLKESLAKSTSLQDAMRGLENITMTTKEIGTDSFSVANQRNSVGKLRSKQDLQSRMEAKDLMPNAINKSVEFPPVSRVERQASKEFEITEEERELLARASRENSFGVVTWKSIEQTAIEIQREYHYTLQDILNVILKNPFQKSKTHFITELERLAKFQNGKPTLEPNRSDNDNQMADRNGLKSDSKKEIPDGIPYSLAVPLPNQILDPDTTPNSDTERNPIYPTVTPSLPFHSTSKENSYPATVVQEQKRQHSSPNSKIIVPSDVKDLSHTSALSPGPKVSLLVDKFNQKSNPTSPDRRSNTSSPGGDISKTPRKGSQAVLTPKVKEENSTDDELFELLLAKKNYPKLKWHYAEGAAMEVFANNHVPMKLIINAIKDHGALYPDSIIDIIETQMDFIVLPKSLDEKRDYLGKSLDSRTKNEVYNEKKYNEDSSMLDKKSSKESVTPRSARLKSDSIDIAADEKQLSVSKYDSIKQDNKQRENPSTSIPKNEEINRRDKIVSLPIGAADKNNNPLFALHSSVVNLKTNEIPLEYQLNSLYRDYVSIFNYLVYDLQLPARVAKDAIETFHCHNLRSAIIASKTLISGVRPFIRELAPREKDPKLDNQIKEIIFKTVHEFGYSVDDILDAIAYDRCLVIEDIVDVMESKQMMKQRNQRDIEDKNSSPNSKGKEKTVDFLSADQELDIQQYLDRLDSFSGGEGVGGSPGTLLTTNTYLAQRYPTMTTGELNRRHSSDYPTPATGYGSQKNQLGKPFSSTPRGYDSIGNESSAFSRSSSSNHNNNRNYLIDDRLLKIWIKQLERNDVMKELKKRGLLEEKITGESTRCLRELLYRHLVTLMGR